MPDETPDTSSGGPEAAESPLIGSLRAAVAAAPGDVPLRLHLAELLLDAGHGDAAVVEAAFALSHAPGDAQARALMARAMGGPAPAAPVQQPSAPVQQPSAPVQSPAPPVQQGGRFDWAAAEQEVGDVVPPRFIAKPGAKEAPLTVDGSGTPGTRARTTWTRPTRPARYASRTSAGCRRSRTVWRRPSSRPCAIRN